MEKQNEKLVERRNKRYFKLYNNYKYNSAFYMKHDVTLPVLIGIIGGTVLVGAKELLMNNSLSKDIAYGAIAGCLIGLLYVWKPMLGMIYDRSAMLKIIRKNAEQGLNDTQFISYSKNKCLAAYYEVVAEQIESSKKIKRR